MATLIGKHGQSITGTKYDDSITLKGPANAWGHGGWDDIFGSSSANKIYGGDGNDSLHGFGGNDLIYGGRGDDFVSNAQEGGNTRLYGEAGRDQLLGGYGNDFLDGGDGDDWMYGFGGRDTLRGGAGDDTIIYSKGQGNVYSGGAGSDTLIFADDTAPQPGDGGWIEIRSTGESSGVIGNSSGPGAGGFVLEATYTGMNRFDVAPDDGHKLFYNGGGNSDNTVVGGAGDDFLVGGKGNETFLAGEGNDAYLFKFDVTGMGHDIILDYSNIDAAGNHPTDGGYDFIALVGSAGTSGHTDMIDHGHYKTYQTYNVTEVDGRTVHNLIHTLDVYGDTNNLTVPSLSDIWF